jgi:single-stranded-DNA-specific exonuclease
MRPSSSKRSHHRIIDLFIAIRITVISTLQGKTRASGAGDLDIGLAVELEKLAPFGCQNEKPLFQIKGIQPSGINYMGTERQHVRFSVIGNSGRGVPCNLFQKAQDYGELLANGQRLDLAGYPDINVWNGDSKIQFVLRCITC